MAIKLKLDAEDEDARRATAAATQGVSLTGFSASSSGVNQLFGEPAPSALGSLPPASPLGALPAGAVADDHARTGRPGAMDKMDREPFGSQEQQLAWPKRPGFHRYWFNDISGRVARARRAGYTPVIDPDTGGPASRITDRAEGRGRASFLMETPEEWYQEDMARQAAVLDSRLRDIKEGRSGPGAEDKRYIPSSGIRITGR